MHTRRVVTGLVVLVGGALLVWEVVRPAPAPPVPPGITRTAHCEAEWGRDTEEAGLCIRRSYCRDLWGPETASASRLLYRDCVRHPPSLSEAAETCRRYSDDPNACAFDEPFFEPPGYP